MSLSLWVLYLGLSLLLLQATFAYFDDILLPSQMPGKGLPFVAHGGMWGDLVLTAWLAYLTRRYGAEWLGSGGIIIALPVAITLSDVMHELYKTSTIREAHVKKGQLTVAGVLHFVYMVKAFTIILLFYAATPSPDPRLVWATTGILTTHVAVANHFVLGMYAPEWYGGRPLQNPAGWATVLGSAAALVAASWWRVGW